MEDNCLVSQTNKHENPIYAVHVIYMPQRFSPIRYSATHLNSNVVMCLLYSLLLIGVLYLGV